MSLKPLWVKKLEEGRRPGDHATANPTNVLMASHRAVSTPCCLQHSSMCHMRDANSVYEVACALPNL